MLEITVCLLDCYRDAAVNPSVGSSCLIHLFSLIDGTLDLDEQRYKLFEQILEYFPVSMRPPSGDLTEFVI